MDKILLWIKFVFGLIFLFSGAFACLALIFLVFDIGPLIINEKSIGIKILMGLDSPSMIPIFFGITTIAGVLLLNGCNEKRTK